jgi:peptide/nickel transport system substrate-binding protein
MPDAGYWQSITQSRTSRRRALAAGPAGFAAAAFLAACGSDDGGDGAARDSSGLIHTPVDSSDKAKAGGIVKHFLAADITPSFDSLASNNSGPLSGIAAYAYPRLVKYSLAKYPKEYEFGSFEGDLAESWEVSPDKLQVTFKIRQGVKWDARAPTNGRLADAQDVIKSWEKFTSVNPGRITYVYDAVTAPSAPVVSLTAPDARTIVIKLNQPDSSIIPLFAGTTFSPMPREFDGGFDPRTAIRGHGPWVLEEYVPSVRFVWRKNPDYYVKGRPFPDRIEVPIVPEYAARLAQFKAGNIHTDVTAGFGGGQADVVPTKREFPAMLLTKAQAFPTQSSWGFTFGWDGNAPFKDQRMRQAASMLIDREGYIDVLDNRDGFRKDGLELEAAYNTVVSAGWPGFWLDPKDEKNFGPNSKYLKLDIAEAKKLIAAAGQAGAEFDYHYDSSGRFPILNKVVELYTAMFIEGGLKPKLHGINTVTEYTNDYYYGYQSKEYAAGEKKGFGGILNSSERPFATIGLLVFGLMHKDGAFYKGMSPDGRNVQNGDPKVNDLALKIQQEFDVQKQQTLTQELIRYFTGQSYYVNQPSQAKAFGLWWPAIANLDAFSSGVSPNVWSENRLHWWVDDSKAPLKRT